MMIKKVIEITNIAGQIVKEGFGKNLLIEYKTNEKNLVTEIDKKSEAVIIDYIKKNFPTHSIIAEESGIHTNDSEYTWVIDPLDGTTNFAHGLPIFSVSIGVQKGRETYYGAVLDVMRGDLYTAEKSAGAFLNGEKISVNDNSNISTSFLVTGFPYDIKQNPDNAIEKFNKLLKNSRGVRRLGSAAIDFCYLAKGVFDGFWEVYLNPWDISAGKLIVEEAGGLVTNFKGEKVDIFNPQILASNSKIHDDLVKIMLETDGRNK